MRHYLSCLRVGCGRRGEILFALAYALATTLPAAAEPAKPNYPLPFSELSATSEPLSGWPKTFGGIIRSVVVDDLDGDSKNDIVLATDLTENGKQ